MVFPIQQCFAAVTIIGGRASWEARESPDGRRDDYRSSLLLMASTSRLDRRAKAAMAGLVLVLFGLLALTARSAIVAVTPDGLVSAPTPENSDELIQIGRHTVLLKHGSASNRIAHWIHGGSANSKAFEVGDGSFVANSDALTPDGEQRVGTVARMMTHVRDL